MKTSKRIDSCIEEIKKMLGDTNNELTSGQRETLIASIRDLKRLRKAKRVTHEQIFVVVARIAATVHEVLEVGVIA